MSQSKSLAQFNTFVGGLITEATELTFPANSASDLDNVILSNKGDIVRRLGIDFEEDYVLSTDTATDTELETFAITTGVWNSVNNSASLNFLVVQLGNLLSFYDMSSDPISSGEKSFTLNLDTYKAPAASVTNDTRVSMSVGRGGLFIVSSKLKPILVEYDSGTDSISVTEVDIKIRDFEGIDDGLDVDEEPVSLSDEHEYNLLNQGWYETPAGHDPLAQYFTDAAVYPANNTSWWQSKDDITGHIDTDLLRDLAIGTTFAPKGHFILDPFNKDRSTASGIGGLTTETVDERPTSVAFFAGRICFSLLSDIYVSQLLNSNRTNAGICYQAADPTSEDISELIDTDGLVISIPEAGNILVLEPLASGLLAFADNGVWFVSGTDGGFKSTDYSVTKITQAGVVGAKSVVSAEGIPYWLSSNGIHRIKVDEISNNPSAQNITDSTIKTFYNEIDSAAILGATGVFDRATRVISWLYKDEDLAEEGQSPYHYNRVLNYDTLLQAFYPFTIASVTGGETPFIAAAFNSTALNRAEQVVNVVNGGDNVVDGVDNVIWNEPFIVTRATFVSYVCVVPDTSSTDNSFTFGTFENTSLTDWEKYDIIEYSGTGANYSSYLETGFDLQGDMIRFKQAPYIFVNCRRTETGFIVDENDDIQFDRPSSCYMQARWEWADHGNSGKFGTKQQVYRFRRNYIADTDTLEFNNGHPVTTTRNKVRGRGRALQLRFESEAGKDFQLLGWGINYLTNNDI